MVIKKTALVIALALAWHGAAAAADYSFRVDSLSADLSVQADGAVRLRYAITFTPQPGSRPVDIVDIGMPADGYDLGTARASMAGRTLGDIRRSEYVTPGIEVHLGASAIAPGRSGTLEFEIMVNGMIFADSDDARFASLQFKSTWYDGKYVVGNAERIEIQFNLPPGSTPDNVKYHSFGSAGYKPSETFLSGDGVVYRWLWLDRPATAPYAAGASFPRELVASVASPPRPSLLRPLLTVVFAFFAFVLSLAPFWIIGLIIFLAVRGNRRRQQQYLPPRIGIESGGIKRGLTPPEAALLQELPLPQVLLLVIFGLLKKGLLDIRAAGDRDYRFGALPKQGLELLDYEKDFFAAIDKDQRLDRTALRAMLTNMIKGMQAKMAGFSRRETNAYYQSIMDRAWEQVRNAPKEKLPEALAEALQWLAVDREYERKLAPIVHDTLFIPRTADHWYRRLPAEHPAGSAGGNVPDKGFGQGIGAAAGNLVGSLQVFSGALLGDSAAFTSSITRVTNPPPVAHYSGSGGRSGGGSSCACACACACAGCACACAGGGR
jgi:hypothetical protein